MGFVREDCVRRFLACGCRTEAEAVQRLLNWVASESVGRSPVDRGLLVAGSVAAGLHAVQQSSREWGQRMQREAAGLREELVVQSRRAESAEFFAETRLTGAAPSATAVAQRRRAHEAARARPAPVDDEVLVEDRERAVPASRSVVATMEASEDRERARARAPAAPATAAAASASAGAQEAATPVESERPYRRCRAGKEKQLKVARREFFKAKRSGDRGRVRVTQRELAQRASACREGEETESESGPGRRARGGGAGRRPRAASGVGLRHRRRSYLHAGGTQDSSNGPWAALSGSPWAASSNRAGRRQRDHPR